MTNGVSKHTKLIPYIS